MDIETTWNVRVAELATETKPNQEALEPIGLALRQPDRKLPQRMRSSSNGCREQPKLPCRSANIPSRPKLLLECKPSPAIGSAIELHIGHQKPTRIGEA